MKSSDSDSDDPGYNNYSKGKRSRSISPVKKSSLGSIKEFRENKTNTIFNNHSSFRSTDSDLSLGESNLRTSDQDENESSLDSCSKKFSSLNLKKEQLLNGTENMEPKPIDEEIVLLQRSGSVSAKTSLFQQLEKKLKEEEKVNKVPKGYFEFF